MTRVDIWSPAMPQAEVVDLQIYRARQRPPVIPAPTHIVDWSAVAELPWTIDFADPDLIAFAKMGAPILDTTR